MVTLRLDLKTRGAILTAAGIQGWAFEVGIALRCQGWGAASTRIATRSGEDRGACEQPRLSDPAEQTEAQDGEDEEGNPDVEPVPLGQKE